MATGHAIDANNANMRRFVDEALNRGILDVVDETRGEFAEQSNARIRALRHAFPDFYTTIENLIAEEDWVAFHLRHVGTRKGDLLGVAATGTRVDFRTMVDRSDRNSARDRGAFEQAAVEAVDRV